MASMLYDNLEDARSKLKGTVVYYNGTPVIVIEVSPSEEDPYNKFMLTITKSLTSRYRDVKSLDDPLFNFTRYNLGYANDHTAVWWYRVPIKQYQQGLRYNQLKYEVSNKHFHGLIEFKMGKPVNEMLLNNYPCLDEAIKQVMDGTDSMSLAFHKDFAVAYDKIHKDTIVEYKGKTIGYLAGKQIHIIDEFKHLQEYYKEASDVR